MEFHPLANVLPMMDETAFAELVADIEAHGLREPVMMYEGKVLDGRNRFKACEKLGIPAELEYLNGEDPVSYVLSMNVHRRHLTTSQRAMIAAELANMKVGRNWKSNSANLRNNQVSQPDAAKLLNVSERSVQTAAYVRDNGTDEEKDAVISGQKKASRVAENIRAREKNNAEGKRFGGDRLKVPDGHTVQSWVESAAPDLENATAESVAEATGFSRESGKRVRELLLLTTRTDLSETDAAAIQKAVADLNTTRQLSRAYDQARPIVERIWGTNGFKRTEKSVERRREQFANAVGVLLQACSTGSQLDVPHLSRERTQEMISQLEQARKQLNGLISKLKDMYA